MTFKKKNGQTPDEIIEKRIYAVLGEFDSKYHQGRIMKKKLKYVILKFL